MSTPPTTLRRLIILRHAESKQALSGATDHARVLSDRGRQDAPRIGARLGQRGWVPEVVLSSDANRTRQTWMAMGDALGGEPELRFTRKLYLAGVEPVRAAVATVGPEVRCALVLGHNPGLEEVVYELCTVQVTMFPCSAVLLSVRAQTWADAAERRDWEFEAVLRTSDPEGA